MSGMEEREKSSGNVGCFIMGAIAFILPPLYVLSIGPFTWLAWQCPALLVLDPAFRPIYFVAENCELVMDALNWYTTCSATCLDINQPLLAGST
jgi:hypothetical protein